jgi:hypothetical protein
VPRKPLNFFGETFVLRQWVNFNPIVLLIDFYSVYLLLPSLFLVTHSRKTLASVGGRKGGRKGGTDGGSLGREGKWQ